MSVSPLNITAAGDSGAYPQLQPATTRPDPVVTTGAPVQHRPASDREVSAAIEALNDFARKNASTLDFSRDEETGKTIVKVVDTSTDTVIRQIPSEEAISIAKSIDKMQGVLINHTA